MRLVLIFGIFVTVQLFLAVEAQEANISFKNKASIIKMNTYNKELKQKKRLKSSGWNFSPRKFVISIEYLKHLANKKERGKNLKANIKSDKNIHLKNSRTNRTKSSFFMDFHPMRYF